METRPQARGGGPYEVEAGEWVHISGECSTYADSYILAYHWTAESGYFYNAHSMEAKYKNWTPGTYTIVLEVTDNDGLKDTIRETVTVTEPHAY